MTIVKALLQSFFIFFILKYTNADLSAGAVYSMLAAKIDVLNDEMSLLRQVLMSTKSELTSTKVELKSTQTKLRLTGFEVEDIRAQCGLVERTTKSTTPPAIPNSNSINNKSVEMSFGEVMKYAIKEVKAHQKQTKRDIANLENKVIAMNESMASNRQELQSMGNDIDELVVGFVGLRNKSDKTLAKLEQETETLIAGMARNNLAMSQIRQEVKKLNADMNVQSKIFNRLKQTMRNEMKDINEETTNNTRDQMKLERNMAKIAEDIRKLSNNQTELSTKAEQQQKTFIEGIRNITMSLRSTKTELNQLSEDLRELSDYHEMLSETVKIQKSQITEMVKTEMSMTEHCQVGIIAGYDINKNPFPATYTVAFKKPFTKKPTFSLGTVFLDIDYRTNLRISAEVKELTETGAKVFVRTWADTRVYGAKFSWMACPT